MGGSVRIDGIKTSSSALAYINQLFEGYDWEAFAYVQSLTVGEVDSLVRSLKVSSADDKKTWMLCFESVAVPYKRKVEGCVWILDAVIEDYKQGAFEAYSHFDAYKRVAAMIANARGDVTAALEKYISLAEKYGAEADELAAMKNEAGRIGELELPLLYENIEDIPQIKQYMTEKNAAVVASLAADGIDADSEYWRARSMIDSGDYVGALNILLSLRGYSDSEEFIEKLDKYFLIGDVLEIEGKLYYFSKAQDTEVLSLYPAVGGVVGSSPIISDIANIVGNHANLLYYISIGGKLKRYDLSCGRSERLTKESFSGKSIYYYNRQFFLLSDTNSIWVIDLYGGTVRCAIENVRSIDGLLVGKLIYRGNLDGFLYVADLNTMAITRLVSQSINIHGVMGDLLIYSQNAPNALNLDLYVKDIKGMGEARLLESNVYSFCDIMAGKIFYYVGNSVSKTLISITPDGGERRELPRLVHTLLFEQKGFLYFIRRSGHNSVLCKCRHDGSDFRVIAADVERFINIKNGYLYYVNSYSALVKVRMDGSNRQSLCDRVESVLAVRDDKIVFVSYDDNINVAAGEYTKTVSVKSIYAVDFTGGGKIKLAYNVKETEKYSENTVYYIKETDNSGYGGGRRLLYRLNVESNVSEPLLALDPVVSQSSSVGCLVPLLIFIVLGLIIAVAYVYVMGGGNFSDGFSYDMLPFGDIFGITN